MECFAVGKVLKNTLVASVFRDSIAIAESTLGRIFLLSVFLPDLRL